jgi:hypothetical protein
LLYVAARHLRLSWRDWIDAPWWVRRAYIEGLVDEGVLETAPTDIWEVDPLGAGLGEFRKSGFKVIEGGV